jgi:uncharacterized protein YcaQ
MSLRIDNRTARRLWLQAQGVTGAPVGPLDVADIVARLGLVQLDTIRNVVRAHDHILWSRNRNYREGMLLDELPARRGFEHFSHDACVLPMWLYPLWRRQFARMGEKVSKSSYYRTRMSRADIAAIRARIEAEGPLSTHAFDTKAKAGKGMWSRPPHKVELDIMWYAGELATARRDGFTKVYDLATRVIPAEIRAVEMTGAEQIDGLCRLALERLAFATVSGVKRFWEAVSVSGVKAWAAAATDLVEVEVQGADGAWTPGMALPGIEARIEALQGPGTTLRIMNPFDPVIRDRARLLQLFGFEYRIEIFVPAAKRKWGYYVYPLLEGDRMVGRIDLKGDRASGCLNVVNLWAEPGVKWTAARRARLEAELARLARFAGLDRVVPPCPDVHIPGRA